MIKESSLAVPEAPVTSEQQADTTPSGSIRRRGRGRGGVGTYGTVRDSISSVVSGPVAGPFSQGPAPKLSNMSAGSTVSGGLTGGSFSGGHSNAGNFSSYSQNFSANQSANYIKREPGSAGNDYDDSDDESPMTEEENIKLRKSADLQENINCFFYCQVPQLIYQQMEAMKPQEASQDEEQTLIHIGKCRIYKGSSRMEIHLNTTNNSNPSLDAPATLLDTSTFHMDKMSTDYIQVFEEFAQLQLDSKTADSTSTEELSQTGTKDARWHLLAPNQAHYLLRL